MDLPKIRWRKSSHSGTETNCVETATLGGMVAVRDSKNPEGPHLVFGLAMWQSFLAEVKSGMHGL